MAGRPAWMSMACIIAILTNSADAIDVAIVDTVPGTFIDISGTGLALGLADDQETVVNTTIGNALLPAGPLVVGTNGGVAFGGGLADLDPVNQTIPSPDAFNGQQALLPFWDDIDDPKDPPIGEDVFFQQIASVAIIQWDDFSFVDQVSPAGGASATIGYQDGAAGNNDFEWSFDTLGAVSDGDVLSVIDAQNATVFAQFLYQNIEQTGARSVVPRGTFQVQIFVPEPSAAAILLGGLVLTCRHRRKRRQ